MSDHDHSHSRHGEVEDHDRGLSHDILNPRHRRAFLGLVGAGAATIGGAALLGSGGTATAADAVSEIPSETAGPYPGDGSNGPDALAESGIVRRDIRRSFGSSTTRAPGQKLEFKLRLVDTADLGPLVGYAVYAWHCDRDGEYSMYGAGITGENYLRGVQVTNHKGVVRFRSIYPACYSGRWPHIHFEVYRNVSEATGGGTPLVTSQMALPRATSMRVYSKVGGYEQSVTNLNRISISSDMVFGDDGGVREMGRIKGDLANGLKARLVVPVDV
jgi:protocatechuate 3,4-dioxygenase beta subunit